MFKSKIIRFHCLNMINIIKLMLYDIFLHVVFYKREKKTGSCDMYIVLPCWKIDGK